MGKKKKPVMMKIPLKKGFDYNMARLLAGAHRVATRYFDLGGGPVVHVVGKKKRVKAFKKSLARYGFLRKEETINMPWDKETLRAALDNIKDKNYKHKMDISKEGCNVKAVPDDKGVCQQARHTEKDLVPVDQGGEAPGEDGRVPASDPGRPASAEKGSGYSQMAVPVPEEVGEWLTVSEYSAKYGIHESTLYSWIRPSNKKRPTHPVPISKKENSATYIWDGHMVPVKEKLGKRFVYRWVNRENLENANSQVNGSL